MRVVALSNERRHGADPDIPWALEQLSEKGLVSSFRVHSTRVRAQAEGTAVAAREIAGLVSEIEADVVAFFHTGSCVFDDTDLDVIRRAGPRTVWIYHEGDAFQRWSLRYPGRALPTVSRCHAAFPFCGGYLAQVIRRTGCRFVDYAPSWVNTKRFPRTWSPQADFKYDVTFVGNNTRSRIRRFPGARARAELVKALQQRYGSRLALYGSGWSGAGVRGRCGLDDVSGIYAESKVCVGIDHLVSPGQFSNRLPVALACGIPLAHSAFEWSPRVLRGLTDQHFFATPAQAVGVVDGLLALDEEALDVLSRLERRVAESLSCDKIMEYMLLTAGAMAAGADPRQVPNPWL